MNLTTTRKVAAELSTDSGEERVTGRVSFFIVTTRGGKAAVREFNLSSRVSDVFDSVGSVNT